MNVVKKRVMSVKQANIKVALARLHVTHVNQARLRQRLLTTAQGVLRGVKITTSTLLLDAKAAQ